MSVGGVGRRPGERYREMDAARNRRKRHHPMVGAYNGRCSFAVLIFNASALPVKGVNSLWR